MVTLHLLSCNAYLRFQAFTNVSQYKFSASSFVHEMHILQADAQLNLYGSTNSTRNCSDIICQENGREGLTKKTCVTGVVEPLLADFFTAAHRQ